MYILNRIGCKRSVKVSDIVTIDRNNFEYAEKDRKYCIICVEIGLYA